MKIQAHEKLILAGDSTTDCGRERPVGEGGGCMGDSYARVLHALLDMNYPELHIRAVNMGVSGNTSRDLLARWETDVLALEPDWVSVMIGINDVWRQFDRPNQPEQHVYLDEYRSNLEKMAEAARGRVKGMVFLTPFYMEQNRADPMRAATDRYSAAVRETAAKYHLLFGDTQEAMDRYFQHYTPNAMSWDRVHPNHVGHMIVAKTLAEALDFEWRPK